MGDNQVTAARGGAIRLAAAVLVAAAGIAWWTWSAAGSWSAAVEQARARQAAVSIPAARTWQDLVNREAVITTARFCNDEAMRDVVVSPNPLAAWWAAVLRGDCR